MTSRGNSSISPPVQHAVQSQPRQVNALPSGTPPPQPHFYTGQTQGGLYEVHSQAGQPPSQPLLTHQAYGSTHQVNDLRISSGTGRGAVPQQALPPGGNFYQTNMRPQQPQQPQQGTYFITSTPNVRQPRPQQQQAQQQPATTFFMIPPQSLAAGTNVVIPTQAATGNMHQYNPRNPLFIPGQAYNPYAQNYPTQPTVYYQPQQSAIRGATLINTAQPARVEPEKRKRTPITIKDPKDGRDLTEELCQRPQSADSQMSEEQVIQQANQTSKEVQHEFVSKVAELLQTPQPSNNGPQNEQAQPSIESNGLPQPHFQPPIQQNHSSQQNQQQAQHPPQPAMHPAGPAGAPHAPQMVAQHPQHQHLAGHPQQQQQQQQPHARPAMMNMMPQNTSYMPMMGGQGQAMMAQQPPHQQPPHQQPPHPGGPGDMMGHVRPPMTVNLAVPPPAIPQVRQQQPSQMYMPAQRHPQPPRPQVMPPNTPPPGQVAAPPLPAPHQLPPHHAMGHPPLVQTSSVPEQSAPPKAPLSRANSGPPASVDNNKPVAVELPLAQPQPPQPTAPAAANIPPVNSTVAMSEPEKEPTPPIEVSPPPEVAPAAPDSATQVAPVAPVAAPVVPEAKETTPPPPAKEDSSPQADEHFGASTQSKDVRKNKKKKDFNRKDIGGSDMDAFIDLTKPYLESSMNQPCVTDSPRRESGHSVDSGLSCSSSCSSSSTAHSTPNHSPPNFEKQVVTERLRAERQFSSDSGLSCSSTAYNTPSNSPPNKDTSHQIEQNTKNLCLSTSKEENHLTEAMKPRSMAIYEIGNAIVLDRVPGLNETVQGINVTCNNHSVDSDASTSVEESTSDKNGNDINENKQDHRNEEASEIENIKKEANAVEEKKPTAKPGKANPVEKPSTTQVLSKHKLKKQKKKEKKGRKSPPGQKGKALVSETNEQEGKDVVDTKPSQPPAVTERQSSVEKPVNQEPVKPAFSYAAAANNDKPKQPTPEKELTNGESLPAKAKEPSPVQVKEPTPPPVNQKEPSPEPPAVNVEPEIAATVVAPVAAPPPKPSEPSSAKAPEPRKEEKPVPVLNSEPVVVESSKDNGHSEKTPVPPKEDSPSSVNDENVPPVEAEPEAAVDEPPVANGPRVTRDASGRLIYERKYLLELRSSDKSLARPVNLPDLEIILDNPCFSPQPVPVPQARSRATASMGNMDFTPGYFIPTGSSNQRGPPGMPKRGSQGGRPGERDNMGRMGPPQKVITRQSMGNDVKPLHKAENAWVPKVKEAKEGKDTGEGKTLEQEVLFIMNRLTPTNFEKLAQDMRALGKVKTYQDLEELVKIFFDKVTIETKFVSAYAQLCKVMAGMKVPPPPGLKENQATFRVVLLTKCQKEFEADKTVIFEDPEAKKKELEKELPDGPKKAEEIDHKLYHMKLRRLKFYGNIRFIGELFKLNMLTENIMHDCIFRLLKAKDDDSLLSLCNLISTVGQHLDTDKAKARMDQYFTQMAKIAEEHKSRIKFTLKDVLDLRRNHWVPRKADTGPKKIDEVHKDFEKEQATKQFLANMPPPPRNDPPPNRRGSRQRPDQDRINDDGWNTVGTRSMRIDASKMKLSKPSVVDENSIQLGPGGGMNKFSMWGRGSLGSQPAQQSQDERQNTPSNRFSALRDDKDRRNFERSPSRENGGRGMRSGPTSGSRGKMISRSSQEGERRDLLASARSIVGGGGRSQNASRDNSWNRDDRRQTFGPRGSGSREPDLMTRSDITPQRPQREEFRTPVAPAPVKRVKEMSEEEIETKAKNNLEEYLNVRDLKEAKLCVTELVGQPKFYLMVTASINDVLEKSTSQREATGIFMNEIAKDGLLSLKDYKKGLAEVLEYAEDMEIDIPFIWTNLAHLMTPMLMGETLPMDSCLEVMKQKLGKLSCAKMLAQMLTQIKEKKGEEAAAQIWQSGGCKWTEFLPSSDVADFLESKKLQFVEKARGPAGPNFQRLTDDIVARIKDARPNREIIAFIENSAGNDRDSKDFIRAITTAVTSSSIMRSPNAPKANEEVIKSRKDIMQHFIRSDPKQELQALYAIQALMTKLEHPSGVISCLFDTLYDEDVITEESCKQWEKSTDPAEQEGKGVCSMQLTQFFTWLSENDEPEAAS